MWIEGEVDEDEDEDEDEDDKQVGRGGQKEATRGSGPATFGGTGRRNGGGADQGGGPRHVRCHVLLDRRVSSARGTAGESEIGAGKRHQKGSRLTAW